MRGEAEECLQQLPIEGSKHREPNDRCGHRAEQEPRHTPTHRVDLRVERLRPYRRKNSQMHAKATLGMREAKQHRQTS